MKKSVPITENDYGDENDRPTDSLPLDRSPAPVSEHSGSIATKLLSSEAQTRNGFRSDRPYFERLD